MPLKKDSRSIIVDPPSRAPLSPSACHMYLMEQQVGTGEGREDI